MGCDNSKTVRVQPVGAASLKQDNRRLVAGRDGNTQTQEQRGNVLEYDVDSQGNKVPKKFSKSARSRDSLGSNNSLEADRSESAASDRQWSATSKQSADSGLGDDYAHVITENSDPDKVRQIEEKFSPREGIDLSLNGVACPTRVSAKDRQRLEESMILQSLREEGLITRPTQQASGGVSFEIVAQARPDALKPLPPARLEKLEKKRKKKKPVTEEEIKEKLERAERRRKRKELERLERIREMEKTDAMAAKESQEQIQKSLEEQQAQRMEAALDNRERKLQQLRERMRERERRAEEVRKRKQLAKEADNSEGSGATNEF